MLDLPQLQVDYATLQALENPATQTQLLLRLATSPLTPIAAASDTYFSICTQLARHYMAGKGLPKPDVYQALHWYNTARQLLQPVPAMDSFLGVQGLSTDQQALVIQAIGFVLRLDELGHPSFEAYES